MENEHIMTAIVDFVIANNLGSVEAGKYSFNDCKIGVVKRLHDSCPERIRRNSKMFKAIELTRRHDWLGIIHFLNYTKGIKLDKLEFPPSHIYVYSLMRPND